MKALISILLILSTNAVAETMAQVDDSASAPPAAAYNHSTATPATEWLESIGSRTFYGQTVAGKKCALYITKRFDNFSVVVAYDPAQSDEEYIGMFSDAPSLRTNKTQSSVDFSIDSHWGNKSKKNSVKVELNDSGLPVSALGESDLLKINCLYGRPSS